MNLKTKLLQGCLDKLVDIHLPKAATQHKWPIRFNHCFRRVIYDNVLQGKWDTIISTPGKDHLSDQQLSHAIQLGLSYLKDSDKLIEDNKKSLSYRK